MEQLPGDARVPLREEWWDAVIAQRHTRIVTRPPVAACAVVFPQPGDEKIHKGPYGTADDRVDIPVVGFASPFKPAQPHFFPIGVKELVRAMQHRFPGEEFLFHGTGTQCFDEFARFGGRPDRNASKHLDFGRGFHLAERVSRQDPPLSSRRVLGGSVVPPFSGSSRRTAGAPSWLRSFLPPLVQRSFTATATITTAGSVRVPEHHQLDVRRLSRCLSVADTCVHRPFLRM